MIRKPIENNGKPLKKIQKKISRNHRKQSKTVEINTKRKVEEVDAIEDSVIELIKNSVKPELAFFSNALKTGSLPQEWINTLIVLLTTGALPVLETASTDEQYKTALMNAQVEKICKRGRKTKRNIVVLKKHLGKTRRSHK